MHSDRITFFETKIYVANIVDIYQLLICCWKAFKGIVLSKMNVFVFKVDFYKKWGKLESQWTLFTFMGFSEAQVIIVE